MTPEKYARARIARCSDEIDYALKMARLGNPLAGEPDPVRRRARLGAKAGLTPAQARAVDMEVRLRARAAATTAGALEIVPGFTRATPGIVDARERIWGETIDFVDVAFLSRGARIARSVGRVALPNGKGEGSGVLVGARLFLTNNHVVETAARAGQFVVEFDYERDEQGSLKTPTRFEFDPSFFVSDAIRGLDFSLLGIGARVSGPGMLEEYGITVLSDASDKHMIGEFANIVQHPAGRLKEVVLRENRLVSRFDDALHYVADTEPGSSGSPVYNSEWQMIALHHWGGPLIGAADPTLEINEGIRVSSIVRYLRNHMRSYPPQVQERLETALAAAGGETAATSPPRRLSGGPTVRLDASGRATWTIPLEVSVALPWLARGTGDEAEPAPPAQPPRPMREAAAYSDRLGYLPHFLPGFHVPLPELGPGIRDDAARLIDPVPGANPYELKYHHFSVVMNRRRRLAFFAACMIDGESAKLVDRDTRTVSDLEPDDPSLLEAVAALDDAEADSWRLDPRIDRDEISGDELYRRQVVAGFPEPNSPGRIARMFQKGHLVRRIDPAWGGSDQALAAELDTFHWTNAVPQVGFFNQGTADPGLPGTGRGRLWRAAENYVLRNAVAEGQRVVSFTGPIFGEDDRAFRDTRVPAHFFKVAAWVEAGTLRSLALIVDQGQVISAWPEAIGTPEALDAGEAFQDPDELDRVTDFLSTVEEVGRLTGLDFGAGVRDADIRRGQQDRPVNVEGDLPLGGGPGGGIPGAIPAPEGEPDDLTRIRGIGPQIAALLNRNGVFHFRQVAAWAAADVQAAGALLRQPGRIERDGWVEQARDLAAAS